MTPSYCKHGDNYLPVIKHEGGRKEVIWGDPLVNIKTAKKFAALHIHDRRKA